MEAVTFDTIREAYRKERASDRLQSLNKDFYEKVLEYINRKRGELQSARSRGGRFGNKMVKQHEMELENAEMTLRLLCDLRESKLLKFALAQSNTRQRIELELPSDERELFEGAMKLIKDRRTKLFGEDVPIIEEKPVEVDEAGLIEVKFLQQTPKFLGLDLKTYGPYNIGDVEKLPKELSDLLVSRGKAQLAGAPSTETQSVEPDLSQPTS